MDGCGDSRAKDAKQPGIKLAKVKSILLTVSPNGSAPLKPLLSVMTAEGSPLFNPSLFDIYNALNKKKLLFRHGMIWLHLLLVQPQVFDRMYYCTLLTLSLHIYITNYTTPINLIF